MGISQTPRFLMVRVACQERKLFLRRRHGSFPNTCITLGRPVPCFCEGRCLQVKSYHCMTPDHKMSCLLSWSIGNSSGGFCLSRHCHVSHVKEQISSETSFILFLDILSSTVIKKPKFSSLEENHLPSETNHTPKKISDSVEEKVEIQKGKVWLATKVKCFQLCFSSGRNYSHMEAWRDVSVECPTFPKSKSQN